MYRGSIKMTRDTVTLPQWETCSTTIWMVWWSRISIQREATKPPCIRRMTTTKKRLSSEELSGHPTEVLRVGRVVVTLLEEAVADKVCILEEEVEQELCLTKIAWLKKFHPMGQQKIKMICICLVGRTTSMRWVLGWETLTTTSTLCSKISSSLRKKLKKSKFNSVWKPTLT